MTEFKNPNDPLKKEQGAELMRKLGLQCKGHQYDEVISAALNLAINAIRQKHDTRMGADAEYREKAGKTGQLLLDHYDSVTGKRKSIFPFTQHISMPFHVDPDLLRKH
jgi:hypothetical protein